MKRRNFLKLCVGSSISPILIPKKTSTKLLHVKAWACHDYQPRLVWLDGIECSNIGCEVIGSPVAGEVVKGDVRFYELDERGGSSNE